MDTKLLTENGWKTIAHNKVKDNGLQQALALYQKIEDDNYDARLKGIESVRRIAEPLKKSIKQLRRRLFGFCASSRRERGRCGA